MGFTPTDVDWADVTWPVVIGCDRVGPGCDNCWAILSAHVRAGNPHPAVGPKYQGLTLRADGRTDWAGVVRTFPDQIPAAFRARKPKRVFVASQGDVFHDQVPEEFLARLFAVMALAHWHTFTVLTKRHGRMRALLSSPNFVRNVANAAAEAAREHGVPTGHLAGMLAGEYWPLPNLELVVSVENQQWADIRIPALLDTPAAVRGISAEPLLGLIDLHGQADRHGHRAKRLYALPPGEPYFPPGEPGSILSGPISEKPTLDWVIAGGESGPKARPMHPQWARSLRDQCAAARVPFFFKQWGEWAPTGRIGTGVHHATTAAGYLHNPPRRDPRLCYVGDPSTVERTSSGTEIRYSPEMRRVGKKDAGHVLDGREHREYPVRTVAA